MPQSAPISRLKMGALLAVMVVGLAGCSSGKWGFPYRADVQQGNWLTASQVALLQPGMTRDQVQFALGSPMLTSMLHANRWDYPYYFKPGYGEAVHRQFTVWFENDRLVRWEGSPQPNYQPFQQEAAEYGNLELIPVIPPTQPTEGVEVAPVDIDGQETEVEVGVPTAPPRQPSAPGLTPVPL